LPKIGVEPFIGGPKGGGTESWNNVRSDSKTSLPQKQKNEKRKYTKTKPPRDENSFFFEKGAVKIK